MFRMKMKVFAACAVLMAPVFVDAQNVDAARIEVPLKDVKGANNSFHDRVYGVSLTYPAGWELVRGFRWGENYEQTTFGLRRLRPSVVSTSLFYQQFTPDSPRPAEIKTWFHDAFRKKEASRQKQVRAYRNVPESLTFETTTTGFPKSSYLATFTAGSGTMAEYYVRVAGHESYVMFITQGSLEDIDAIRTEIDRMADTVRVR
jgi:hypothetical protein